MPRRRLEDRIALDFFVLLKLLELAQQRFQISESLDIVLDVLDEVGAGVYQELDFRQEARHITRFSVTYQRQLRKLGVVVPEVVAPLSGPQVAAVLMSIYPYIYLSRVCERETDRQRESARERVCVCERERQRER